MSGAVELCERRDLYYLQLLYTWMSQEVRSMVRINGLFHLLINANHPF